MQKFRGEKCKNLAKTYGREMIKYGIIKLLLLSSQCREFHKLFVQLIFAALVFERFFSYTQKIRNFAKKFAKYEWEF